MGCSEVGYGEGRDDYRGIDAFVAKKAGTDLGNVRCNRYMDINDVVGVPICRCQYDKVAAQTEMYHLKQSANMNFDARWGGINAAPQPMDCNESESTCLVQNDVHDSLIRGTTGVTLYARLQATRK